MEKNKKSKKRKRWIRFRHTVITLLAFLILTPIIHIKYRIKIERFQGRKNQNYLVLLNHQTPFDQFFVGISFRRALYYVATEDIFSLGFLSTLLRFAVAPIPIKKQTTDIAAVMNCIRVAKEGGSIVIAPEGNRTYSGKTEYMSPVIASLAKKLQLPIALYRIEGGYGAEPRWSDKVRHGKMKAYVSRVVEPDEYRDLSDDELYRLIVDGLYVDEAKKDYTYSSHRRAEYLDRCLYVCPKCGFAKLISNKNTLTCSSCKMQVRYEINKTFTWNSDIPQFKFVNDWYEYQKDFVNRYDPFEYTDTPVFTDTSSIYEVILYKKKYRLKKTVSISLFGDRITINDGCDDEMVFPFNEVTTVAVLGRNKANIYYGQKVYQLKGDKRFNALKYVNLFFRYQNITKGDPNGKFLGL